MHEPSWEGFRGRVVRAIASLALAIATVVVIAGTTSLILFTLNRFGVQLHTNPVIQVMGVACMVAWRLYRGSTPLEEIRLFLNVRPLETPHPGQFPWG